jgi:FeS assembly protein IscX
MLKYGIMSNQPLYWDSAYEIVLELMELYPDADIEAVGLEELNRWIVNLPNFADDPVLVNDGILKDILREWYEETST